MLTAQLSTADAGVSWDAVRIPLARGLELYRLLSRDEDVCGRLGPVVASERSGQTATGHGSSWPGWFSTWTYPAGINSQLPRPQAMQANEWSWASEYGGPAACTPLTDESATEWPRDVFT